MAVVLHDVGKAYDDKIVLQHFSLSLPDTGIVCFLGPSGCGKTTLLHLIFDLIQPDAGTIRGLENKKRSFVFQEDRLLPWLSIFNNLTFTAKGENAMQWLKMVGLEEEIASLPSELSGGMRRRASLARAFAADGDVFMLDEPFKELDPKTKLPLIAACRDALQGKLAFFVTHDAIEALLFSDQIIVLSGPPLQVTHTFFVGEEERLPGEKQTALLQLLR